jgi:hypothetical protein
MQIGLVHARDDRETAAPATGCLFKGLNGCGLAGLRRSKQRVYKVPDRASA